MTKFKPGFIIEVNNVGMNSRRFKVVEVWDDPEVPRLLVTDEEQLTQKCWVVLQCDCTVKEEVEYVRQVFKREVVPVKDQRVYQHVSIGRD